MKPKTESITWALAVAVVLSLAAARPCAADVPNPTPTDLGILAGYQYCAPNALNASCQVVGECEAYPNPAPTPGPTPTTAPPRAMPFIWESGTMSALHLPSGFAAGTAVDINASGQVVGSCWNWYWWFSDWEDYGWRKVDMQACLWQRGANGWSVALLGAPAAKGASQALLINDAGQIYAHTWATDGSAEGSAVLTDGAWIELKDAYGDLVPWEFRPQMNESGQVLAWSQYGGGLVLWSDGTPTTIVQQPYLSNHSLDNLGRVAGVYWPDGGDPFTAYLYQPDAGLQTAPTSTVGWVCGLNDNGQVLSMQQVSENGNFLGTDLYIGGLPLAPPTTTIGRVPGCIMYYDTPIMNANGELAGIYAGGPWGAYYASATAGVVPLDGLGDWGAEVYAMNDLGVIVGTSPAADGCIHAVLWGTVPPDGTAPEITAPVDIFAAATSPAGAVVTFTVTATDNLDGPVTPTVTPPSGSTFPLGTTTVNCTAADNAGNSASASFNISVTYPWSGVLQPINADGSSVFKAGSTVPVKFKLTGASAGITTLAATLSYAKVGNGIVGTDMEAVSTVASTTGNLFRYDATTGQYIFNWSTKGLSSGTYQLSINLGDGVGRTVALGLK